jgi:hypothetical protein|tara:strand:+ start:360 stop:935 length:576 start_codon:yes stop_codon:yes gene_type:complete
MNKKILIFLLLFIAPLKAEQFYSIEKFTFELPEGYIILNNDNIYNILDSSNHSLKLKKKMRSYEKILKKQNVEILLDKKESQLNKIYITIFNNYYKVNKKKVLKQCRKILKLEQKAVKKKVDLIECRMHNYPKFADWSMYRENENSFFENQITQQIIFMFKKKEYIFTSACYEKCNQMKSDLFNLVKSIKF